MPGGWGLEWRCGWMGAQHCSGPGSGLPDASRGGGVERLRHSTHVPQLQGQKLL